MKIQLKNRIDEIKWKFAGILGKLLLDFLFCKIKVELTGFDNVKKILSSRRFIFACWHSRILFLSYYYKGLGAQILVSQSKDGEIIARILHRQGCKTIRGSSTRGGLKALAGLIRTLKKKKAPCVVTPDGPLGPRFKVQPGVITIAKKTGFPIIPISYSAKKIKIFSSWDSFIFPYPFTKCRIVYGQPVYVLPDADKQEEKRCRTCLEKELGRITFEADRYFNHTIT